MNRLLLLCPLGLLLLVASCGGMRSEVSVTPNGDATLVNPMRRPPSEVVVTEGDIVTVPYQELAEIRVTLSKNSMLGDDPTELMLERALQAKAAELGADAVVRVRYGEIGVSMTSWGRIAAAGRAVRFVSGKSADVR